MKIPLGVVGHFWLAVSDPERSAKFWTTNFDLKEIFRFDGGIGLSNDAVTIVFFKGNPNPEIMDHMSFHLKDMNELRAALEQLRKNSADLEDPGDEIGPEAPDSPHMDYGFTIRTDTGGNFRFRTARRNALKGPPGQLEAR